MKYSHYDDTPKIIPTATMDEMTPIVGSYTPASAPALDIWEETKYIIYQQPDPTNSPYLELSAINPFFEFTSMGYYDIQDNFDLTPYCPITYTSSNVNYELIIGAGVYSFKLKDGFKEVPGTYIGQVEGTALNNVNPLNIKFSLILKDFCEEIALQNSLALGKPVSSDVKYSHYNDIARDIPTTTIDEMTPILGSYTPASAPAFDIWEVTKYIIYQQPDPTNSPYLETSTKNPFFEFTDMIYEDSVNNDIRGTCPITYTLSSTSSFVLSLVSGN